MAARTMTDLVRLLVGANASRGTSRYVLASGAVAVAAILASAAGASATLCWNVAWTAAAVSAITGVLLGRAGARGANRRRWALWSAAAGCWLLGQLAWDLFAVVGLPASPNVADIGYWGFAVLVSVSMLRVPGRSRSLVAVTVAETLPLIAAATALTFAELWLAAAHSSLPLPERVSALVYPAVYVSAAILTLQAIVGGSLSRSRSTASLLVLGGIIAQALAFILWSEQLLRQSYVTGGSVLDPLWVLGLLAIGAGGVVAAHRPEPVIAVGEPSRRGGVLPASMFVVLIGALVHAWLSGVPTGAGITLVVGLLLCGVSLIVRGVLLEHRLRALLSGERRARLDVADREAELARLNERLAEDSRRDALTGLRNRRALSDDQATLEATAREGDRPTAFALCDIDHFKAYNDYLGHLAGDQALRAIASTIRATLRAGDIAYRFGGEELLLVFRDTTAEEAVGAAERIRAAVADIALRHPAGTDEILTISIGVAPGPAEPGTLLADADAALYEAKRKGRNRVALASPELGSTMIDRRHDDRSAEPVPRHLRGTLAISRAGASGRGPIAVLEALAATICSELSFATVAVNLLDREHRELRAVVVLGDKAAQQTLLGSVNSWEEWEPLMSSQHVRCGAVWLPAGSYDWRESAPTWTPPIAAAPGPDSWHPDDMLLLPLRAFTGEILGVVSVDEPLNGQRPNESELKILMAVADHAGLALEHALNDGAHKPGTSQPDARTRSVANAA